MTAQLGLAGRCQHCGAYPVPPLLEVLALSDEAKAALGRMRLALPPVILANLGLISEALVHHAGACKREMPR